MRNALSVTRRGFMTVAGASSLQGLIAPQASLWTPPTELMTTLRPITD